jgi:hypothetical protein
MKLFVAYTEKNAPVAMSSSVEGTVKRIQQIEEDYKRNERSSLLNRVYQIWEVNLVPNKITPDDIVRTIPIKLIQTYPNE